jgi:hypothetical protein
MGAETPPKHPENPAPVRGRLNKLTAEIAPKTSPASVQPVPVRNFIDGFVFSKMERDRVPHAGLSTDAEFLRRVHLDLTGRLPEPEAIRKFLADQDADKRDKTIDALLATPIAGKLDKPQTRSSTSGLYFLTICSGNSAASSELRKKLPARLYLFGAVAERALQRSGARDADGPYAR